MSTELREEYEDLLRYAVVLPVSVDAKKMAGGGGGGGINRPSTATMVSRTTMVSSATQLPAEHLSMLSRTPQPHPSPLNPECKKF